jgi:hypothetical protein
MAAADPFANFVDSPVAPSRKPVAVTPDNATELATVSKGLFIGGAGTLTVLTAAGDVVLFTGVLAGSILPIAVRRVNATGTTCTNIVAL